MTNRPRTVDVLLHNGCRVYARPGFAPRRCKCGGLALTHAVPSDADYVVGGDGHIHGATTCEHTDYEAYKRAMARPAPPTDEEIVRLVELEMRTVSDERRPGERREVLTFPGGHRVTVEQQRAAWSRVLAAKVRASDEQRRRDGLVYGPIDDPEEI